MTAIDKIARYVFLALLWGGAFFSGLVNLTWYGDSIYLPIILFILAGIFSYNVGWRPTNNLDKLTRYVGLGLLWSLTTVLALAESGLNGPRFAVIAIIAAIFATIGLFPRYTLEEPVKIDMDIEEPSATQEKSKRKNDQVTGMNPLDVLTPEDLYELRQDIKDELRARILGGSDGELTSLDSLLAARNHKTAKK